MSTSARRMAPGLFHLSTPNTRGPLAPHLVTVSVRRSLERSRAERYRQIDPAPLQQLDGGIEPVSVSGRGIEFDEAGGFHPFSCLNWSRQGVGFRTR